MRQTPSVVNRWRVPARAALWLIVTQLWGCAGTDADSEAVQEPPGDAAATEPGETPLSGTETDAAGAHAADGAHAPDQKSVDDAGQAGSAMAAPRGGNTESDSSTQTDSGGETHVATTNEGDGGADASGPATMDCATAGPFTSVAEGPMQVASTRPNQLRLLPLPQERVLFLQRQGVAGAIYHANSDTWTPLPPPDDLQLLRLARVEVIGERVVFWHPDAGAGQGALYDLATETWTEMNVLGAPVQADAVEMVVLNGQWLVFGGDTTGVQYGIGHRFDPASNRWHALGDPGLTLRADHIQQIAGDSLLVWGGYERVSGNLTTREFPDQPVHADGARLNSDTWSWEAISDAGAPSARALAMSAWTGEELIVFGGFTRVEWGGYPADPAIDGYRYSPDTDAWAPINTAGAPAIGRGNAIASAGQVLFWGQTNEKDGTERLASLYDPSRDSWQPSTRPPMTAQSPPHATSPEGSLVALTPEGQTMAVRTFDIARNEWKSVALPEDTATLGLYSAWLGNSLLLWGGYVDTTAPNQCLNAGNNGCDPVSSFEPVLGGLLYRATCASQ